MFIDEMMASWDLLQRNRLKQVRDTWDKGDYAFLVWMEDKIMPPCPPKVAMY